ncbi:tuber borchii white collar-1 [Tricharina praecox]|uniref:tuber borchii white collar-1 n=1 Tax=Tricharina praecox TaxID=43433 RepID=UPI0022200E5D|nr:tuber borchii white collar-1 [Tricharina praecox]KAI5855294.1 tuber borchii white collar-1 [Tricharina praecox]
MDIDGDDLNGYLGSGGFVPTDLAAAHSAAEDVAAGNGGMQVNRGGGGFGQSDDTNHGADMDAMVAERRRSLANGFGLDYLSMGEEDSFSSMVSPTFTSSRMSVPTTLEDVMDMSAPVPPVMSMLAYGTTMSAQDMQASMSMFSNRTGSITPRASLPSPVDSLMPSVPTSPAVSIVHRPQRSLSSTTVASDITMGQGPTQRSMIEQPLDHSTRSPDNSQSSELLTMHPKHSNSQMPAPSIFPENIYSSSGFDMMDILNRVANRPNPEINIGAVDMSCAFVVTDARKFDTPIVYCSATFERLTGYTKHEVLGRNCRFLQAPDGNIKAGDRRKYVDENAVYYLKNQIAARAEAQTSLINYRKGGQSFTNLLTMIPITYDDTDDVVYIVGFQVDLVDQPSAMLNRNRGEDGSFSVNYQYTQMPTYIPAIVMDQRPKITMGRDDVSQVLASFGNDLELHSKRILDKVLLENTDDVVHVLSLKGLFLYCSPSIRKVLEYEPHELVGTSLSGVCHPSDIVPVTRDLKDTSSGTSVNVVFRIRRKFSGYTWFESHGCLHTEQGKGRKCIILVGRERPVYVLRWKDIHAAGGIGENELWTKLSTSGMFLHVSSNSKLLLDREAEDLIGTSVQALMRPDSKNELGKALEVARMGNRTTVRHEIQNKRGQFLQALTTLFPGDGGEYQRPTFLIAQTRLLKHSRASATAASPQHKSNVETPSSHSSTPSGWSGGAASTHPSTPNERSKPGTRENSADSQGEDNMFEELKTTRSTSWQFELRQMQRTNKRLIEELNSLLASKKKRKRRKGVDQLERDCANCHTRVTPEWRRGPSGKRDLCNSCGLRYAKLIGRGSSRTAPSDSDKGKTSPMSATPMTHSMLPSNGSPIANHHNTSPQSNKTLQPIRESATSTLGGTSVQQQQQQQQQQHHQQQQHQHSSNHHSQHQITKSPIGSAPVSPTANMMVPIHIRRGSLGSLPPQMMSEQPQQIRKHSHGSIPHLSGGIFTNMYNGTSMMQGIQSANLGRSSAGSGQGGSGGGIG